MSGPGTARTAPSRHRSGAARGAPPRRCRAPARGRPSRGASSRSTRCPPGLGATAISFASGLIRRKPAGGRRGSAGERRALPLSMLLRAGWKRSSRQALDAADTHSRSLWRLACAAAASHEHTRKYLRPLGTRRGRLPGRRRELDAAALVLASRALIRKKSGRADDPSWTETIRPPLFLEAGPARNRRVSVVATPWSSWRGSRAVEERPIERDLSWSGRMSWRWTYYDLNLDEEQSWAASWPPRACRAGRRLPLRDPRRYDAVGTCGDG